jgi:hypothetical protein
MDITSVSVGLAKEIFTIYAADAARQKRRLRVLHRR